MGVVRGVISDMLGVWLVMCYGCVRGVVMGLVRGVVCDMLGM